MQKYLDKLKSIDYKTLVISHVEKVVLALVLVYAIVTVVGANWPKAEQKPEDLAKQIQQKDQMIVNGTWPKDQKQLYTPDTNVQTKVAEILRKLPPTAYGYPDHTPMTWPLVPPKEKIREPTWQKVDGLLADFGLSLLSFQPPAAANSTIGTVPQPGAPQPGLPQPGFAPANPGDVGVNTDGSTVVNARGMRYVSIRGVFPLRQQLEQMASAMHLRIDQADRLLKFVDFELERQTAVPGADPWAGEWEPVDISMATEVLRNIEDFEIDLVSTNVIDHVFTMPLPKRIDRPWGYEATHPQVQTVKLSNEEVSQELISMEMMIDQYQQQLAASGPPAEQLVEKGGFSTLQHNIREIKTEVNASNNAAEFWQRVGRTLDPEGLRQLAIERLRQRTTAGGRVLLFRYFDFDVVPGNAYRYRVRLKLLNPNYELPVEDVEKRQVREGTTRETPWSNTSNPVVVEQDLQYFVKKVSIPSFALSSPYSNVELMQWNEESGTFVKNEFKVYPGSYVGGTAETDVITPAASMVKKLPVEFRTHDILVDLAEHPRLMLGEHSDLIENPDQPGVSLKYISLPGQAVTINRFGELKKIPYVDTSKHQTAQALIANQELLYQKLIAMAQAEAESNRLTSGEGIDDTRQFGTQPQRSNPVRKSPYRKQPAGGQFQRFPNQRQPFNSARQPRGFAPGNAP